MKRAAWTLAFVASGCAVTGTAELPAPRAGMTVAPNVASVPTLMGELFDFPPEALTSRASLVRMDDAATCFDLVIRRPVLLPKDQGRLPLRVSVDVDGAAAASREETLPVCSGAAECLPADSALRGFVPEDDARIRVEGARVCFERLPKARREVVLSANPGGGAWRFRFRFAG